MARLRDQLVAAGGPQPDILAKKRQSDQFKVGLGDGAVRVHVRVCVLYGLLCRVTCLGSGDPEGRGGL